MNFYFYITSGCYPTEKDTLKNANDLDASDNICISAVDFNEAAEKFVVEYKAMIEGLRKDPTCSHKWIELKPEVGFETKYGFDKYSFDELENNYYFAIRMLKKLLVRQELDAVYCDAIRSLKSRIRKQNETI